MTDTERLSANLDDASRRQILAARRALSDRRYYDQNYTTLAFGGLGTGRRVELGSKPFKCRFCDGRHPERTFRKRAHAISELLGNKTLTSLYECDRCNERFRDFEDDLAKMTLPARSVSGVIGKNGNPTLIAPGANSGRMQVRGNQVHFSRDADGACLVDDPVNRTLTFTYASQRYRPLGAYKALCKSAFTLIPEAELVHFSHLKSWLLQADLTTHQVYSRGSHICYSTTLAAFQPFKQPIVCLLKRKKPIDAPYMSFVVATGNFSYQIFLPCPTMDEHLRGKKITIVPWPHSFQLQPWRIAGRIQEWQFDLSASERTSERTGSLAWSYEEKVKVV